MLINKLKKEITISNITRDPYYEEEYLFEKGEASPPKLCLDDASVIGFRGFSFIPMTDSLL